MCMSGAKVKDVKERLKEIENYNIKNLIIHVGGNNIPMDSPDILSEKIIDLLLYAKKVMHSTKVYFSAIIPRCEDNYLPGINYVNRKIRHFCDNNAIFFIPHYQFYSNNGGINYDLLIKDKVHPTRRGSNTIAKNIIAVYRNYGNSPRSQSE